MVEKKNQNKRPIIKLVGYSLLILLVIFTVLWAFSNQSDKEPLKKLNESSEIRYEGVNETIPAYQKKISEIEHKYNINIEYKNPPRSSYPGSNFTVLSPGDMTELAKYVTIFYEEFNKYPPDFIKNVGLREVYFVKNLSDEGLYIAAEPDYINEALFYDIYHLNEYEVYQRVVVHHEFYHMIEEEINGDPYYKDPVWASFNDPNFKYGSGWAEAYGSEQEERVIPESGGFISSYSTYGLEEDKAEIYAYLFIPELANIMYSLALDDLILDKKVRYMKEFLAKYSRYMNEDFWQKILLDGN